MDAAMVIGLTDPQGGKVKRSDYALKDEDYVIQAGDTPEKIGQAMKVNPQSISDLGSYQQGDVIPGMPQEQKEVSMEEAHRVDASSVSQDPEILSRLAQMGVSDPSQLSSEDYVTAQMIVFNDVLAQEKEVMGEAFNEDEAIKNLSQKHPKQLAAMFKEFGRLAIASKEARQYESSKPGGNAAMDFVFNTANDVMDARPPLGGYNLQKVEQMRKRGM